MVPAKYATRNGRFTGNAGMNPPDYENKRPCGLSCPLDRPNQKLGDEKNESENIEHSGVHGEISRSDGTNIRCASYVNVTPVLRKC
jgi:hypothetical protein